MEGLYYPSFNVIKVLCVFILNVFFLINLFLYYEIIL